jgi:hypothetical protein
LAKLVGSPPVERCLACEADGEQGHAVRNTLPIPTLCVVSIQFAI